MTADWKSFSWSSCGNEWGEQSCGQRNEKMLMNTYDAVIGCGLAPLFAVPSFFTPLGGEKFD